MRRAWKRYLSNQKMSILKKYRDIRRNFFLDFCKKVKEEVRKSYVLHLVKYGKNLRDSVGKN